MKKVRVAINGFGRIGRVSFRVMEARENIEVVAVNDLAPAETLAHLLKYDSIHRKFNGNIQVEGNHLVVNGKRIRVLSEKEPQNLPWKEMNVDVVIESTGRFLSESDAKKHLEAGAQKVIISAPAKDSNIKTVVLGVNDHTINSNDQILSNASCTTNNAAPMLKVLDDNWGVEWAYVTTVHSYTSDQNLQDGPHKDLRRARAAAVSIIPTTTGAAKAITEIFPHLKGRIGGAGIRVPVQDGSLTDISCILKKSADIEAINQKFQEASNRGLKGILEYTSDPIVSVDVIGNTHSCLFDSELTSVLGSMVKVVGWYDNEMGYSNRLADLVVKIFS